MEGVETMSHKNLKAVKYYHRQSSDNAIGENTGKESILILFNRPLHPLEAMGIFHMVQQELLS